MMDVGRHPNIALYTHSKVIEVTGKAGDFRVKILKKARYVNIAECTSCGECTKVCPIIVPNEFEVGLGARKAIFTPFPQAVPSAYIRYADDCLGTFPLACSRCADVCEKNRPYYNDYGKYYFEEALKDLNNGFYLCFMRKYDVLTSIYKETPDLWTKELYNKLKGEFDND